eukprot:Sdes_comp17600_c0_seq1m6852
MYTVSAGILRRGAGSRRGTTRPDAQVSSSIRKTLRNCPQRLRFYTFTAKDQSETARKQALSAKIKESRSRKSCDQESVHKPHVLSPKPLFHLKISRCSKETTLLRAFYQHPRILFTSLHPSLESHPSHPQILHHDWAHSWHPKMVAPTGLITWRLGYGIWGMEGG